MLQTRLSQSIYASKLRSRAVLVMNYLIYRSNKEQTCFPAIKTIAKDVHVSVNTVKRALDDLVKAGFVKKEARFIKEKNNAQTSNLFTLCEVAIEDNECEQSVQESKAINVVSEKQIIEQEQIEEVSGNHFSEDTELSVVKGIKKEDNKEKMHQSLLKWAFHITKQRKNITITATQSNNWAPPQPNVIPP